ncbi:MAG: tetratricopeptide repeat protein [Flavobacteriales bacterium]
MENQNPFDPRCKELVARFELMMQQNERAFFDADELEEIIDFYGENGDFTSLLSVVEFGLSIYPLNHMLMLKEAQALLSLGRITQGIQRLKKLEKIEKSEELCLTLASVYSQQREHQKSIKYLREALSFSGGENDAEIYLEMAFEY